MFFMERFYTDQKDTIKLVHVFLSHTIALCEEKDQNLSHKFKVTILYFCVSEIFKQLLHKALKLFVWY